MFNHAIKTTFRPLSHVNKTLNIFHSYCFQPISKFKYTKSTSFNHTLPYFKNTFKFFHSSLPSNNFRDDSNQENDLKRHEEQNVQELKHHQEQIASEFLRTTSKGLIDSIPQENKQDGLVNCSSDEKNLKKQEIHQHQEEKFASELVNTISQGLAVSITSGFGLSLIGHSIALPCFGIGFVGSIASLLMIHKYENIQKQQGFLTNEEEITVKRMFWSMCLTSGILITPIFNLVSNSWVIPISLGMTSVLTFVMSRLSLHYNANTLSRFKAWKTPLLSGLIGLIALDISALFSVLCIGSNPYSEFVMSIDLHGGLLLFTGLMAYDAQCALVEYRLNPKSNKYLLAVNMFWDALNFFIRLVSLLNRKNK